MKFGHLTSKQMERIQVLQKRINFLNNRIRSSDKDLSYDNQEMICLEWAVKYIVTDGYRERW
jgi:hypothetical protein